MSKETEKIGFPQKISLFSNRYAFTRTNDTFTTLKEVKI